MVLHFGYFLNQNVTGAPPLTGASPVTNARPASTTNVPASR
jgi:hypothetical protein